MGSQSKSLTVTIDNNCHRKGFWDMFTLHIIFLVFPQLYIRISQFSSNVNLVLFCKEKCCWVKVFLSFYICISALWKIINTQQLILDA